jgi:spore maturation protein CgeB
MKHDYGNAEQGYSFEHYNFYDSLHRMGHDILYFDFMSLMKEHGKEWMNQRLREVAKAERPDLLFAILYTDELAAQMMRGISDSGECVTLN